MINLDKVKKFFEMGDDGLIKSVKWKELTDRVGRAASKHSLAQIMAFDYLLSKGLIVPEGSIGSFGVHNPDVNHLNIGPSVKRRGDKNDEYFNFTDRERAREYFFQMYGKYPQYSGCLIERVEEVLEF